VNATLFDREVDVDAPGGPRVLVVACGAIAREVLAVIELNGWTHVTLRCLPGKLHNTPDRIAAAVDAKLQAARAEGRWDRVFVAYGDCGTGGALDRVLAEHGVGRLPGDHCYAFFAGVDRWLAMHERDPATFYLTDFLCRHFERFVIRGFKLDTHPELLPIVFGNYRRLVYLSQIEDPALVEQARGAADYLGLAFEHVPTGFGDLAPALVAVAEGAR
jgi:hypothetical protein